MYRLITQRIQLLRTYSSGIGKTAVLLPAAFVVAMALAMLGLGLVFYARDVFGASPAAIGLLTGAWSLAYVIGCLVVRPALSSVVPRYLIVASTLTAASAALAMRFVPSLEWLLVLQLIGGIAMSLFWPPVMGWLSTDNEGRELGRVMSVFNFSWSAGVVIGPFVAGWLSARASHIPLLAVAAMYMLVAVFVTGAVAVLPRVRRESKAAPEKAAPREGVPHNSTSLRFPSWVALFTAFFATGTIFAVFPVAARESLALSKQAIGSLLLIRALLSMVGFVVLGRMTFWHFRHGPMVAGQLLLGALFTGLAMARSPLLIGSCFAAVGFLNAFAYTISVFHAASGSTDRAARMAINEAVLSMGLVLGAVVGGMVYQSAGLAAVYLLCAYLFVGGSAVQAVLRGVQRRMGLT